MISGNILKKTICAGLSFMLTVSALSSCKKKDAVVEEIDICNEYVRAYLDAETPETQFAAIDAGYGSYCDFQLLDFHYETETGKVYRVFFENESSPTENFSLKGRFGSVVSGGYFIPGQTYVYKIAAWDATDGEYSEVDAWSDAYADKVMAEGSIKIKSGTVRMIGLEKGHNYRDLGGWKTSSGKSIAYGRIYRGGKTNDFSSADVKIMRDVLKIKSEIDLRHVGDDGGQRNSILGDDANYLKASIGQYSYILPSFDFNGRKFDNSSPKRIKEIFEFLADENNYPLFFHCNAGADRTGTLAFLICGSLGVSLDDLTRDFELTTFSQYGGRLRGEYSEPFTYGIMQDNSDNFVAWGDLIERIQKDYPSESGLQGSIRLYLTSTCGISEETLTKIERNLTENK